MEPHLQEGQLLFARSRKTHAVGQLVIFQHEGKQKIKKIAKIRNDGRQLYVTGTSATYSTDSGDFGWIDIQTVVATVLWPRLKF